MKAEKRKFFTDSESGDALLLLKFRLSITRIKDHQEQQKNQVFIKDTSRTRRIAENMRPKSPKYRFRRRIFSFIVLASCSQDFNFYSILPQKGNFFILLCYLKMQLLQAWGGVRPYPKECHKVKRVQKNISSRWQGLTPIKKTKCSPPLNMMTKSDPYI
jgi:hypothetical protein